MVVYTLQPVVGDLLVGDLTRLQTTETNEVPLVYDLGTWCHFMFFLCLESLGSPSAFRCFVKIAHLILVLICSMVWTSSHLKITGALNPSAFCENMGILDEKHHTGVGGTQKSFYIFQMFFVWARLDLLSKGIIVVWLWILRLKACLWLELQRDMHVLLMVQKSQRTTVWIGITPRK